MAFTLSLSAARTEVIHIAAINGNEANGATGRHSTSRLNAILNRKYRELLSRVGQLGLPHGLVSTSAASLSAVLSGEDFISVDVPSGVSEVIGIDVRAGSSGSWQKLDPIAWEQRRDVALTNDGYCLGGLLPPHGVGFWTMRQAPSVSGSTLTGGKLAVWPGNFTGQYQLHYVSTWVDISSDTDVFLLYEAWDEWLLNAAAMTCTQHDANKRANYDMARDAWIAADNLIIAQAGRLQRSGYIVPTPYRGVNL